MNQSFLFKIVLNKPLLTLLLTPVIISLLLFASVAFLINERNMVVESNIIQTGQRASLSTELDQLRFYWQEIRVHNRDTMNGAGEEMLRDQKKLHDAFVTADQHIETSILTSDMLSKEGRADLQQLQQLFADYEASLNISIDLFLTLHQTHVDTPIFWQPLINMITTTDRAYANTEIEWEEQPGRPHECLVFGHTIKTSVQYCL